MIREIVPLTYLGLSIEHREAVPLNYLELSIDDRKAVHIYLSRKIN